MATNDENYQDEFMQDLYDDGEMSFLREKLMLKDYDREATSALTFNLVSEFGEDNPDLPRFLAAYKAWVAETTLVPAEPSKKWEGWNK